MLKTVSIERRFGSWIDAGIDLLRHLQESQEDGIAQAAEWSTEAILGDGLVHLFGSGHSRIPVEEMFPRYGSFPGFNPIVELSTTFHTQIVGANGQRQAMFIERVPGLAEVILRNFSLRPPDVLIVFSVGGSTALPVEMAEIARGSGVKTVAVTSLSAGGELGRTCDVAIDLGVPVGDAMIDVDGWEAPVGPGSSLAAVAVANEIKVRVAQQLAEAGLALPVLSAASVVGEERKRELFDLAYDEHARRLASRLRKTDEGQFATPADGVAS